MNNKPKWTMHVPVVSTAHVPENYRDLLPDVCSVIAPYDCGDFILLFEDWREKAHADLIPVLDWFVSEYNTDTWLRLDADGCTLDGVKNFTEFGYQLQDPAIAENCITDFIHAYKVALLWSSCDGEGNESFEAFELSPEAIEQCEKECREFIATASPLLFHYVEQIKCAEGSTPWGMAGHDFWLTRAGHGAGFWDGDVDQDLGDQLTALCGFDTNFPPRDVYLGDDQKVYLS